MLDLPLFPVPAEWDRDFETLVSDPWLREKLNRQRRIAQQLAYLTAHATPEFRIADSRPKGQVVIDLGCGPGELLEIARYYGYEIYGVDAAAGNGGMGDAYLQAASLLCSRQDIPTYRWGFAPWVRSSFPGLYKGHAALINARGSWEQMHADWMYGEPHHVHHRADLMRWKIDGTLASAMMQEFRVLHNCLHPDGCLLIHCNRAANHDEFEPLMLEAAEVVGLKLVKQDQGLYKWRTSCS